MRRPVLFTVFSVSFLCTAASHATAENQGLVVRDGTLGDGPAGPVGSGFDGLSDVDYLIHPGHGEQVGSNLLHSFSQFSIGEGEIASFTGPGSNDGAYAVKNIISRVTGPNLSEIDGELRSTVPNADFYLINPAGVVFGSGAKVDVNGAFNVTTERSLLFSNGERFEASLDGRVPLLHSAMPQAFGFLGEPLGDISLTGTILRINGGGSFDGKSINLSKGAAIIVANLEKKGASRELNLYATDSVSLSGTDTEGGGSALSASTLFDGDGGSIHVEAANIQLEDGARISSNTFEGRGNGGTIHLIATDAISLSGMNRRDEPTGSSLRASSAMEAVGNAGSINLSAPLVTLDEGASIAADTFTSGQGGDIRFDVGELKLSGASAIEAQSESALSNAGASGSITVGIESGRYHTTKIDVSETSEISTSAVHGLETGSEGVSLTADIIEIRDGSTVNTATQLTGRAGDIFLEGFERITLSGVGEIDSGRFDGVVTLGSAGSIMLRAPLIEIRDGAHIAANTIGGQGGNVHLVASKMVQFSGIDSEGGASSITNSTLGDGDAGGITVEAPVIRLDDGARIASNTFGGRGDGGNVLLVATEVISFSGMNGGEAPTGSSLRASTGRDSEGDAGSITLQAPTVSLDDAASIATDTFTTGRGGEIALDVGELRLRGGSFISASSEMVGSADGDAGDIRVGLGDEGLYRTQDVVLSDSDIRTFARQGGMEKVREGNISITARGSVLLENGSTISASVETGLGGDIEIAAPDSVVLRDASTILAETAEGQGGAIAITTDAYFQSPDSRVSADAGAGVNGIVIITSPDTKVDTGLAPLSTEFLDASALLRPSCAARGSAAREDSFVVARRRGLPSSPEELLVAFDTSGGVPDAMIVAGEPGEDLPAVGSGPPPSVTVPEALRRSFVEEAERALAEGAEAFRGGAYEAAGEHWTHAAVLFDARQERSMQSRALQGVAQSQQALGNYDESVETWRRALALAEQAGDEDGVAACLAGLGNAYVALGQPEAAHEFLTRGVGLATRGGRADLAAGMLNNLGDHHAEQQEYAQALTVYEEAAAKARAAGNIPQEATALSNAARAAIEGHQSEHAAALLDQALARAKLLPDSHAKVYLLIHLAKSYERLGAESPARYANSVLKAQQALRTASDLARAIDDPRAESYAWGNLGALYQREARWAEALYLTRGAVQAAEQAEAPESLYRWQWQAGQLLWAQGRAREAIAAYRRAVAILEETREETRARYGSAEVYFRRLVAPVYLDLVNALLQASGRVDDPALAQRLLIEARAVVEQLKAAELRDYFRDECVAELEAKTIGLDAISQNAAVIYPILLPDRLELLVTWPAGLKRYTVPVGADQVTQTVQQFRATLRGVTRRYLPPAQQLYDWLVRPLEADLEAGDVELLIFVPDGPLRTIPMAALHDGQRFLVERVALGVTPGLTLIDPQPLDRSHVKLLLAGISEPVGDFPPLDKVPDELDAVHAVFGGTVLLNEEFRLARARQEMSAGHPSVVHIASHGEFTGDPATSFLLAYDGKLTMNDLRDFVGVAQFRDDPLELLVLSACETATGDDRAALGLAGLAIRSGARSALGSLWAIGDQATAELVPEFYRQLQNPSISKAEALRRAQLDLLHSDRYRHPRYWSPFLLISNWL